MKRRRPQFASLLAGVSMVLVACDGGDPTSASSSSTSSSTSSAGAVPVTDPGPGTPVTIRAGDLYFDPMETTVPAGPVTFTLVNDGAQMHTLLIDKVPGFQLQVAARGDTDMGNVALEAGRYVIFCNVPGHQAAGMEGTVVAQ